MTPHLIFDLLAAATALTLVVVLRRWRLADRPLTPAWDRTGYFLALSAGTVVGAYVLGTANLMLTGLPGAGRSVMGSLAGGILGVEIYKAAQGIRGSTGLVFVPAFAALVAVGRLGCLSSGLEDNTHGIATALPWGVDFGDGIARHPVQAYEALAMAAFLALSLILIARRHPLFMARGFHLMVAFYAAQRFAWEFLKPYGPVLGPLNLFHLTALVLLAYAGWHLTRGSHV